MKRLIALVLSLVMALSLCVPAWGEGETVDPNITANYKDLPTATAEDLGAQSVPVYEYNENGGKMELDTSFQFKPNEEKASANYQYWNADFVVYANKDVPGDSMALAGYYEAWCKLIDYKWVALTTSDTISANTPIRLVETMGTTVNYSEICQYGNDGTGFLCGVADLTGQNAGTTLTVELRLYKTYSEKECFENFGYKSTNEETGEYAVIGTYTHTFDGAVAEVNGVGYATLAEAVAVGGTVTLLSDVTLDESISVAKDVTLDLNGKTITNNVKNGHLFNIVDGAETVTFIGGKMVIPAENTAAEGFVYINTAAKVVIDGGTYSGDTNYNGSDKDSNKHKAFFTNPKDGVDIELKNVTASTNHLVVYADAAYNTMKFTGGSYTSTAFTPLVAAAKGAGENVTFTDVTATSSTRPAIEVVGGAGDWMGAGKNTVAVFNDCAFSSTSGDWPGAPNAGVGVGHCADVTINGGTYTGSDNAPTDGKNAVAIYSTGGSVTVKGGTLNGNVSAITSTGTYNVSVLGGMMTGTFKTSGALADKVAISVSGGYFNTDVSQYVADGYVCAFSSAADAYTVQKKVTAENTTATTTTNTAVKNDAVIGAVKDTTTNNSNTVSVPASNNTTAKTTIVFNDVGDDKGAAAKGKFTDEANADKITTELAVADVTAAVQESVVSTIESKVDSAIGTTAEVATYLDIDIHVFVGDQHVGQITELPKAIKVVVPAEALPDNINDNIPTGYTRQFYVVRVHGDRIETILAKLDADGNLVFESHLFSTYAVVYEDVKTTTGWGGYYPVTSTTPDKPVESAKTADPIGLYIGVSILGAVGTAVLGRKRED